MAGCMQSRSQFHFMLGTVILILVILALITSSIVAAAVKHPRQFTLVLATVVTGFAIWRLIREAWQDKHGHAVRVLLFTATFLLAYELYVLFSIVFEALG